MTEKPALPSATAEAEADDVTRGGVFAPKFEIAEGTDNSRFRRARFATFVPMLERVAARKAVVRVLDIGGSPGFWMGFADMWRHIPIEITMVNIGATEQHVPPFHLRQGDACNLAEYADNSFDVVHSNSVVEHVGRWPQMRAMASEVRRLAPAYFVQTPNFWFPYEPHYKTLFIHWYPEAVRIAMVLRKPRGWIKADTFDEAVSEVQAISLLTVRQMAELFPDARLVRERVGPFTKSIVAARD